MNKESMMNQEATFEVKDARQLPVYIPMHIIMNTELSDNAFRNFARIKMWERKGILSEGFKKYYGSHKKFTAGADELKRFGYIDFNFGGVEGGKQQ